MRRYEAISVVFLGIWMGHANGQTVVDLRTQTKNVDFSGAAATKPTKTGSTLPATCSVGEMFFSTTAQAGQNLYGCTGANTWSVQSAGTVPVTSVFGRTGVVAGQSGDYSFTQISGTVGNSQIASGVDAAKIGSGGVTNTVFGYLANVTSNIQTQLNAKASSTHSHTLSGDVSGDLGSGTVVGIRNRVVSAAAPVDKQALVWNALLSQWEPQTLSGSGGGASMASQLGDFNVGWNSTVLTIGANCSPTTPCNVRFGNTVYSITTSATAAISGGSGTAYIYVANGGTLTMAHNLTVACVGCVAQNGSSFPADAVPLYTWTAANGTWNQNGGIDRRSWLSTKPLVGGAGVTAAESAGVTTIAVDMATVPTYLTNSATLTFTAIASGGCSADKTFAVPGAVMGDAVAPGWPSGLEAGLVGMMRVSAANTIAVRLCNLSGASVTPASAAFRAMIVRSF